MAEDEDRERPTKLPVLPKKEGEICMVHICTYNKVVRTAAKIQYVRTYVYKKLHTQLERANGPNILVLTQTPKDPKGEGARAAKVGIGPITSGIWYSRILSTWLYQDLQSQ